MRYAIRFIVYNMVNISGNKVVQKTVGKFFLAKGFFCQYGCVLSEYGH